MVEFIDRHKGGERAILMYVQREAREGADLLLEFQELANSTDIKTLKVMTCVRKKPSAKLFVGLGKAEELAAMVKALEAEVVIFNHELTPAQARNLEKLCCCRVLDRTELILDIFASRARTFEGRLQVELAQCRHLSSRLVRGWTHLERQKGGIGLRGPGETQLEVDRRLLSKRMKYIEQRLQRVRQQRAQGRRRRERQSVPTIALVGYTNAGKSTLFNRSCDENVYTADQLFATLDPTYRQLDLQGIGPVVLVDTVGFIRDLPHDLVSAFHATLEETCMADLLCHVVDVTHPEREQVEASVEAVLSEIGADHVPQLKVYNKIDRSEQWSPRIDYAEDGVPYRVWLSAQTGEGLPLWQQAISEALACGVRTETISILPHQAKCRAWCYEHDAVIKEDLQEDGTWLLTVRLSDDNWRRLESMLF